MAAHNKQFSNETIYSHFDTRRQKFKNYFQRKTRKFVICSSRTRAEIRTGACFHAPNGLNGKYTPPVDEHPYTTMF